MPKRTGDYNSWRVEKLLVPENALSYLQAASSDSVPMFLKALRNVVQAHFQMTQIAEKAGVKRETLYKSLSETGNPTVYTLDSVLKVLGLQITVQESGEEQKILKLSPPSTVRSKHFGRGMRKVVGVSKKRAARPNTLNVAPSAQMVFRFSEQSGTSTINSQQAGAGLQAKTPLVSAQAQPNFIPAYLSNILLGRDHGYNDAVNAVANCP